MLYLSGLRRAYLCQKGLCVLLANEWVTNEVFLQQSSPRGLIV